MVTCIVMLLCWCKVLKATGFVMFAFQWDSVNGHTYILKYPLSEKCIG